MLTDIPDSNDDIDTVYAFPVSSEGGLTSGERHTILLGFRNSGVLPVTVSQIAGSLNSLNQFSFYVRNFTAVDYMSSVEPGKEATFEYSFMLEPEHAGHVYALCFTVFFHDDADTYATTFFNTTVVVLDPNTVVDAKSVSLYTFLVVLFLYGVYLSLKITCALPVIENCMKRSFIGDGVRQVFDIGTDRSQQNNNTEWLKGTSWTEFGSNNKKRKDN